MFTNGLSFQNLDTVQFSENEPHIYDARLIVVSDQGCRDTLRKNGFFIVHEKPRAKFFWTPYTPKMFSAEVTFTDNSTDADIYEWTFTDGTPNSSVNDEEIVNYPDGKIGAYPVYLKVWSNFGCVDSVKHIIQVVSDVIFYAPNTFTPDNDNFNETWKISIQGIDEYNFDLKVFNRYGEIMWESHNPSASWDGTYGGKTAPDGTYVWILQTKDLVSDQKYEYKGHLTILR
jgi:gliding motility-associated-like protein